MTTVVLASASPSRRKILAASGITAHVIVSAVDEEAIEAAHPHSAVIDLATALARAKGAAVLERIRCGAEAIPGPDATAVLIAADSILELAGRPVGKPHTAEATRRVWHEMGGTTARLHTGHYLARLDRGPAGWELIAEVAQPATSVIHTARPTPEELAAYIATTEPFEVAGALTIDGYGGAFVTGIEGDHHNVIGLSLPLVRRLVTHLGVFWPSLWDGERQG